MRRVAIIGGGIAGLSAAFYLERARQAGSDLQWTLFEKSERLGGVIKTEHRDGFVLEAGPDSFLSIKPDAAQLCRDLGIGDQLIGSNDAQRKTYILVKGRPVAMPEGLEFMVPTRVWPMATTPLFSFATKLRMARELFAGKTQQNGDESVGDFVRRHFGQEMVDRVAEPLLAGVYGGNAEHLSLRAVLPRFAEMERDHGSLVRATLRAKKTRLKSNNTPQPLFTSLRRGMQQLVDALTAALPADQVRLSQHNVLVRPVNDDWEVQSRGDTERFQAVVLAVPGPAAAELLRQFHPSLISGLGQVRYTSSAAVAIAVEKAALPPGHGFLVPRSENKKLMACTFVHEKFPYRAPEGSALLRCFFSSSRLPDLMDHSDQALQEISLRELKEILGTEITPMFSSTFRWGRAMPQYETGHLERVAEMEKIIGDMPGFYLVGNTFHGIGLPDCVKSGRLAAEKLINS